MGFGENLHAGTAGILLAEQKVSVAGHEEDFDAVLCQLL